MKKLDEPVQQQQPASEFERMKIRTAKLIWFKIKLSEFL